MKPANGKQDPQAADPIDKGYYQRRAKELPSDPTLRGYVEQVLKDGYVVIPNAFTEEEAIEAIAETDRLHGQMPKVGRNAFDGFKTNRVLSLLGKTRVFDKFCLLPQVLALNDFFLDDDYLIYIMETIVINPGEKNQVLHHDDSVTRLPRPRPPVTAAIMVVLDDYTELNGATRIVPGSHKWGSDRLPDEREAISAVCPRGSIVYFLGTTWHSGGANRSDKPRHAATIQFCQPYIRPLENLMVGVDPRRALSGEIPDKIVDMMGYRSAIPFIGYADGLNPKKATRRMIRRLGEPIDYNPPAFASEPGEKETRRASKL
ncbi:phytanoyl-CoA dioxygenase [Mariannaea sp. PMI_226]|nr:phytanoyl-CoA dioxygenase [Mariannaea sp. PMI_226]